MQLIPNGQCWTFYTPNKLLIQRFVHNADLGLIAATIVELYSVGGQSYLHEHSNGGASTWLLDDEELAPSILAIKARDKDALDALKEQ